MDHPPSPVAPVPTSRNHSFIVQVFGSPRLYAVGSHGYAVERVGNRHGALLVSNNDRLRMGA